MLQLEVHELQRLLGRLLALLRSLARVRVRRVCAALLLDVVAGLALGDELLPELGRRHDELLHDRLRYGLLRAHPAHNEHKR